MTSTISRVQKIEERVITVSIKLVSKDAADNTFIQKFGDIIIDPSGFFNDPNDVTFPKFNVSAGDPIPFYTNQEIRAIFADPSLTIETLQRQANLWGDAIELKIQNAMISLRAKTDTTTLNTTLNI